METTTDASMDLYAGLTLPTKKQRVRDGDDQKAEDKTNATSPIGAEKIEKSTQETEEEAPPAKRQRTEVDVATAIERLKTHMVVDKKFDKAAQLFTKLVREKLTTENRMLFLDAFKELISAKGATWSGKPAFAELVRTLIGRQDLYTEEEKASYFDDWKLIAVTHAELFTDDTFEFARTVKLVKARVDAISEDTDAESFAQLMPLLRTLFSRHSVAWAKTPVESVLHVCTRNRLLFNESDRDQVDQWTAAVLERRNASTITRSSASDARRNLIAMDGKASQAGTKVGRSNHPLFNRDL
ncbi:hypothetical protein Poli38472_010340 [Pythium oligandrum]|uniref:Uncharacterized protein n=1 Tax=Pythium oligandrum TaxID=41045 RepID=A0A8K1C2W6_PYTOL|nr:hypothetical protein Poli38472_010340 [Pythium oligandrum]|eukprot:TMW55458.1 hypothetical protein Poli38472_010340 [Pythium oligandrum]